jgi:hypothetical protein
LGAARVRGLDDAASSSLITRKVVLLS